MTQENDDELRENLVAELAAMRQRLAQLNVLAVQHESNEEILRSIVNGTAKVASADFFRALVRQLATALKVRYAFVTECTNPETTNVQILAFWIGHKFGETFEYSVANTPCEAVMVGKLCFFPREIQELFPMDADLVKLGAESYIGIPLFDSNGNILGHLAVLDDKALGEPLAEQASSILKLFSARAAAELERKVQDEALHRLVDQLQEALATVKTLRGLLPMCAWCRKVRDDEGYWKQLETYVSEHSEVSFTHGMCPACAGLIARDPSLA